MKRAAGQPVSAESLNAAGLPRDEVDTWLAAEPGAVTDYAADRERFSAYWQTSTRLLGRLPQRAQRSEAEQEAAEAINDAARASRTRFLMRHGEAVYDALTERRTRFVRVEHLVTEAARAFPGLTPEPQQIAAEDGLLQKDKDGLEIDQGLFVAAMLRGQGSGRHLCQAMLLPRPEAEALLPDFLRSGLVELAGGSVERRGKAAFVTYQNPPETEEAA